MPERNHRPESSTSTLNEGDLDFVRNHLGYDMQFDPAADPAIYDERRQICYDIIAQREHMRASMVRAARSAGLRPTDIEVANWTPTELESRALHKSLVGERKRMGMIYGLQEYSRDQNAAALEQGVPLREYQRDVVRSFSNFLLHATRTEQGGKSGIIEMPTGTGKTAILANIVAQLKYGEQPAEPVTVLVLVPTQTILEQTMGRRGERGFGKFSPQLDTGAYFQREKELNHEVVIMTRESFAILHKKGRLPHFDAVVVDEVHTFIGTETMPRLQSYIADKIAVGLSATPSYDSEHTAYNVFDHQIYQMDLQEAVESGKLAPVTGYLHDVQATTAYNYKLSSDPNERRRQMRRMHLHACMLQAEKIIVDNVERGRRVIVHCPPGNDIESARLFAEYIRDKTARGSTLWQGLRWVNAEAAGGKQQRWSERQEIFRDFEAGELDVITFSKAIRLGYDGPVNTVIDLVVGDSETDKYQLFGRGMRLMRDQNGAPIEAELHSFKAPDGRPQITCLDVLGTQHGERIAHRPQTDPDAPIPLARRFRRERIPEVVGFQSKLVGQAAIVHSGVVAPVSTDEVKASVVQLQKETITPAEAASMLGISLLAMKGILRSVGSHPDRPMPVTDLEEILEFGEYAGLRAQPLPDTGYTSIQDVIHKGPKMVRELTLRQRTRLAGITPFRFISPQDGRIAHYYRDEDIAAVHEIMRAMRHSAYGK